MCPGVESPYTPPAGKVKTLEHTTHTSAGTWSKVAAQGALTEYLFKMAAAFMLLTRDGYKLWFYTKGMLSHLEVKVGILREGWNSAC